MNFTSEDLILSLKPIKYSFGYNLYSSIAIDSRECKKGSVFFALKGERVDGHNYIKNAFSNGATLCITENEVDYPYIMVKNTKKALLDFLFYFLNKVNATRIAITGSVGKTTTRHFLSLLLGNGAITTPKNYNTELSIPLILNFVNNQTKYLIFEFGLQNVGDISLLASTVYPNISIITKVSKVHLKFFKSFEEIVKEKLSILRYTSDFAVIDSVLNDKVKSLDLNLKFINYDKKYDKPYIELQYNYNGYKNIVLKNIPSFFSSNLIAALEVCKYLQVPFENLNLNLSLPDKRFNVKKCGKFRIIADYYNSNPYSLKKALQYLKQNYRGRKVVVLGDMLELGGIETDEHKKIRKYLKSFDLVILYGRLMRFANDGYNFFENKKDAIDFLINNIYEDDLIFIKGSRSMRMEDFEEAIKCK